MPFIIVLVYFAFFKWVAMMNNPWIFYPVVTLGSIAFVLYKLELLEIVQHETKKKVNTVLAKTPLDFRL